MVGDECTVARDFLETSYPITNGIVQKWDDMVHLYNYTFHERLNIDPSEHKIMLTEVRDRARSCESMREHARSCETMRDRARPCGIMRDHARACTAGVHAHAHARARASCGPAASTHDVTTS